MMEILKEASIGSLQSVYSIGMIVIPLMIVLQLLKNYQVLDRMGGSFRFFTKLFGISEGSIFPLLVGIIFGISYGAGVIIQSSKEGNLTKKDLWLLVVFLITCHAIFEDTLVFVKIGANGYLLFGLRLITAIILTYILSKRIKFQDIVPKGLDSIEDKKQQKTPE